MLLVLFVARTVMAFQFQSVASTAPFLIDAFAIEFAHLGTLIGLYMLPGILIALPGGMLGQRFGARNLVLAGLLLMALGGALMGASTSFLTLSTGRLISGVGAVLINVLMTKMIADWFAGNLGRELATRPRTWAVIVHPSSGIAFVECGDVRCCVNGARELAAGGIDLPRSARDIRWAEFGPQSHACAGRMAVRFARWHHMDDLQCRLHCPDQLFAGTVHGARLLDNGGQSCRQFFGLVANSRYSAGRLLC
jgi:hypothetical protein